MSETLAPFECRQLAAASERQKQYWPPINADERRLRGPGLSAFIRVHLRPNRFSWIAATAGLGAARHFHGFRRTWLLTERQAVYPVGVPSGCPVVALRPSGAEVVR